MRDLIVRIKRRFLDIVQGHKAKKERHALYHWINRKTVEGVLKHGHFEQFYTAHFGLDRSFYAGKKVLDIGCGPRGSLEWADMAEVRVGLDPFSVSYRKLGTGAHSMEYVAARAENMPFADGSFDVVCSFNSLDHVDDLDRTISEISRVTAPGGLFLLLTDTRMYSTICEPQIFSWEVVEKFKPDFKPVEVRHYEHTEKGMYESILADVAYAHSDRTVRKGVISAKMLRSA